MAIRAFVAVEMPAQVQHGLTKAILSLQARFKGLPVRWIPVESIHLTLKFLGEIQEANIQSITTALNQVKQFASFPIELAGIGVFPNAKTPNVIWIGLSSNEHLNRLQASVEAALIPLGYPREGRGFSPHLTLARVKRGAGYSDSHRIGDLATTTKLDTSLVGTVDAVTLFSSVLKPSGAVYNALVRMPLAVKLEN